MDESELDIDDDVVLAPCDDVVVTVALENEADELVVEDMELELTLEYPGA